MADEVARIVIADPDEKYIRSYEEELLKKYASKAVIQIITTSEYKENYFRLNRDIDLLIIDQAFYGDFLQEQNVAHTIVLQSEVTTDIEETENQKVLMKYLPTEKLFEEIEAMLGAGTIEKDVRLSSAGIKEKKTFITAVYSSIGGCGKSLVAMALGKKLKKIGETALVIGCDDMQSFDIYVESRQNADEALAGMIKSNDENLYWNVLKNISNEQVPCLLPFGKPLSALGIGAKELTDLITLIAEKQDFDYIILDLGSDMGEVNRAMTKMADLCILITEPNLCSARKLEKLAMNQDLVPVNATITIANQMHSDGLRLNSSNLFGSFGAYENIEEAMEDPLFYRIALEITGEI